MNKVKASNGNIFLVKRSPCGHYYLALEFFGAKMSAWRRFSKRYILSHYTVIEQKGDNNMVIVEYVESLIYKLEDVKRIVFSNIDEARNFCLDKQKENIENGKAFFMLKFKEMK